MGRTESRRGDQGGRRTTRPALAERPRGSFVPERGAAERPGAGWSEAGVRGEAGLCPPGCGCPRSHPRTRVLPPFPLPPGPQLCAPGPERSRGWPGRRGAAGMAWKSPASRPPGGLALPRREMGSRRQQPPRAVEGTHFCRPVLQLLLRLLLARSGEGEIRGLGQTQAKCTNVAGRESGRRRPVLQSQRKRTLAAGSRAGICAVNGARMRRSG